MKNETGYTMEELILLTAQLSEKYTGYESTSISYEKARQLMGAVLYCIRTYQTQDAALPAGTRISAGEAYRIGYQRVMEKTEETQKRYNSWIQDFRDYGNTAYRDTVAKGIPEFFRRYDARFCPQDHILTLDYPVLPKLDGLYGIDRISRYLKCIELEQLFLGKLPEIFVRETLGRYHAEYEGLFINLAEVVIHRIMGKMLASVNMDVDKTENAAAEVMLNRSLEELTKKRYGNNQELLEYLRLAVHDFMALERYRGRKGQAKRPDGGTEV